VLRKKKKKKKKKKNNLFEEVMEDFCFHGFSVLGFFINFTQTSTILVENVDGRDVKHVETFIIGFGL
jgi:hypothetical protein